MPVLVIMPDGRGGPQPKTQAIKVSGDVPLASAATTGPVELLPPDELGTPAVHAATADPSSGEFAVLMTNCELAMLVRFMTK